jgi:hypothetical protein
MYSILSLYVQYIIIVQMSAYLSKIVAYMPCEMSLNLVNSCFEQGTVLISCLKVPYPMCPLFNLANRKECEPEICSIRVRGRLALGMRISGFLTHCAYLLGSWSVAHPSTEVCFASQGSSELLSLS